MSAGILKNWLIRTRGNQILGPVTKEKIIELIKNNSLNPRDEICSGNGYWFFVNENEMVRRFVFGNEIQTFNPITEARDVLSENRIQSEKVEKKESLPASQKEMNDPKTVPVQRADGPTYPSNEDLAYPDMESPSSQKIDNQALPNIRSHFSKETSTVSKENKVHDVNSGRPPLNHGEIKKK